MKDLGYFVVLKGMFYDNDGFSKSIQQRVVSHTEYLLYYDNSYVCLLTGSEQECNDFINAY